MHGMKLVEGEGNTYDSKGKALEGDRFNTVFIVVRNCLNVRSKNWVCEAHDSGVPLHQIASH